MKKKYNIKKCLLTAVLVLSLVAGSSNTVRVAEHTTDTAEESAANTVIESSDLETPIIPAENSDSTEAFASEDSDQTEDSSDVDPADDIAEINISDITSGDVVFEDDIVYINPCYSDVVTEDDLVDGPEAEAPDPSSAATVFSAESINGTTYYTTADEAAAEIRSEMKERAATISFGYVTTESSLSAEMTTVFNQALTHTGICDEGDYLKWTYGGWKGSLSGYKSNGSYYLLYTYTITYYTTAEQETSFASEVDSVFRELGIAGMKSDYDKIEAIYQYICSHVTYDYTNLDDDTYKLKYTAYAALINGTSVCQGYANLFYYMALKAGIDARFISGDGNGGRHGWNIVQLDGLYYDMDSTWDSKRGGVVENYKYFLKCDAEFPDHTRDADYSSDSFNASYPMAETSYQIQPEETATVYGHSLVLDGTIGLIFYLDISDAAKNAEGSYVCLKNTVSGTEEKIAMEDAVEADGYYRFVFPVAAKEMADPITLTFYEGSAGTELCTDTCSVADYAEELAEAGDSVSELAEAMLDYGTCAQIYFGYQTENPANAGICTDGEEWTIADVEAGTLSGYARVKEGTMPEGIHTYGQSLVLNDGVSIKFYYQLDDGADIKDYSAALVSGDSSTALEWQESGVAGCYYVEIEDVNAAELDTMYEVDVTDGTSGGSVQYSAMTYVYNTLSAAEGCSDSLKNLCRAMYYYNQAADRYFAE